MANDDEDGQRTKKWEDDENDGENDEKPKKFKEKCESVL